MGIIKGILDVHHTGHRRKVMLLKMAQQLWSREHDRLCIGVR